MTPTAPRWRQCDAVSCGPAVVVVAGALMDSAYRARLTDQASFADAQARVRAMTTGVWPRRLGTTPARMARAIERLGAAPQRWRPWWGRRDRLVDVLAAIDAGWPVAMLVGGLVPRHWVLIVGREQREPAVLQCYEPSSGEVRPVRLDALRTATLVGVGFNRPHAFVLPRRRPPTARHYSNI